MLFTDYDPGPPIAVIASTVLLVILVCVIAPIAVFIIWKKRRVGKTASLEKCARNTVKQKAAMNICYIDTTICHCITECCLYFILQSPERPPRVTTLLHQVSIYVGYVSICANICAQKIGRAHV